MRQATPKTLHFARNEYRHVGRQANRSVKTRGLIRDSRVSFAPT